MIVQNLDDLALAQEVLSKTPDFYHCELIEGILENECNELFLNAKKLAD
jgi:hypothetical protein